MSIDNPWSQHYQSVWLERTSNTNLPAWLRVASLAFGRHRRNGHANFAPGEIALILASVNEDTGEVVPMDKGNVQRAIRDAVKAGFLSGESGSLCLVVPGHAIEGGIGGSINEPCKRSHKAAKSAKPELRIVG